MNRSLSFVIPIFNEAQSLQTLYEEIVLEVTALGCEYEIIFVDDGSSDNSKEIIRKIHKADKAHVVGVVLAGHQGKAAALSAGFSLAKNEIVFTLDADLQDDPKEIYRFIAKLDEGYDLVSGWKQRRKDSFIKNQTSKIYNAVTGSLAREKLHDFNCGFKAYKREVAQSLLLYGHMHRYIPIQAELNGYRIAEVPIDHRKRPFGKSKYGPMRFLHGLIDFFTISFLVAFRSRPFHFFGISALLSFIIGIGLAIADIVMISRSATTSFVIFALILTLLFFSFAAIFICFGLISELLTYYMYKANRFESISHILKSDEKKS